MQKIGIVFCIFHEIRFTLNFLCKKNCILVNKVCHKLNTISNNLQSLPTKHQDNLSKQL